MAVELNPDAFGEAPDLAGIESVLADPLRFKLRLRMGEDTYVQMRVRKRLQELWDVYGMAMTGAGVAASPWVASTFFASTGGLLSFIGIGVAATPIGWVLAAGLASGGLYFGVTRWVAQSSKVDVIPHFINSPLDVLAMGLFDLVGSLALRVARIDGKISPTERTAIRRHFVEVWGYDPSFVSPAMKLLEKNSGEGTVKDVAQALAQFQASNPDCNAQTMQKELLDFLRDVVSADGKIDERETLALEAIERTFRDERALTLAKVGQSMINASGKAGASIVGLGGKVANLTRRKPLNEDR